MNNAALCVIMHSIKCLLNGSVRGHFLWFFSAPWERHYLSLCSAHHLTLSTALLDDVVFKIFPLFLFYNPHVFKNLRFLKRFKKLSRDNALRVGNASFNARHVVLIFEICATKITKPSRIFSSIQVSVHFSAYSVLNGVCQQVFAPLHRPLIL